LEHYNYFRDYDPSIGRYIESDPIGLAGGINTFGYVFAQPLWLIDADGLRPGPAGDPDREYRWRPDPRDWYPGPTPDGTCMVLCLAIDLAAGHGFLNATGSASNVASGSGSAGFRVLGAIGGVAARALGHTPAGRVIEAGLAVRGCATTCRKHSYCEIQGWAKGYQNMPLPPFPPSSFPRK
jgi:uncharacterized protein RhaS with RHS repeats